MAADEIQSTRDDMLAKTDDNSQYHPESNGTIERDNQPKQITLTIDENGIITAVEQIDDQNLSSEDLVTIESENYDYSSYSHMENESDPDYRPESDLEDDFMNGEISENEQVAEKESVKQTVECDICKKKLSTHLSLKSHVVSVHTKKCHSCSTTNVEKEPWAENVKASDKREIKCTSCNETLTLHTEVGRKKSTKGGGGMIRLADSIYMCTECNKLFLQKDSCIQHQSVHKEKKDCICDICGGTFAAIPSLRRHVKGVHGKSGKANKEDTDFDEDVSYNKYKKRKADRKMKKDKAKNQNYECTECNRHYDTQLKFRKHLYVRHGFKSECNICHKTFTRKDSLEEHMVIRHTMLCLECLTVNTETEPWPENAKHNTRSLSCSKCQNVLTMINKPGPRTIKSTREGGMFRKVDGKFACMECGKMFTKKSNCEKHQPLHMKIKPHGCPYLHCTKAFTQRDLLAKHVKKFHSGKALH